MLLHSIAYESILTTQAEPNDCNSCGSGDRRSGIAAVGDTRGCGADPAHRQCVIDPRGPPHIDSRSGLVIAPITHGAIQGLELVPSLDVRDVLQREAG